MAETDVRASFSLDLLLKLIGTSTVILVPLLFLLGCSYQAGYFREFGIPISLIDLPVQSTMTPRWTVVALFLCAILTFQLARVTGRVILHSWTQYRNLDSNAQFGGALSSGLSWLALITLVALNAALFLMALQFPELTASWSGGIMLGLVSLPVAITTTWGTRISACAFAIVFAMGMTLGLGSMDATVDHRISVFYKTHPSDEPKAAIMLASDPSRYFLLETDDHDRQLVRIIVRDQVAEMWFYTAPRQLPHDQGNLNQWLEYHFQNAPILQR